MKINYSNYSYEELLDVKHNIDKEAYPERYQTLLNELALRLQQPNTQQQAQPSKTTAQETEEDTATAWDWLVIYNFKTPLARVTFGLLFIAGLIYFLINILPSVFHTRLANLPAYTTEIHNLECKRRTYRYKGKDRAYYNLELTSYGFTFYVANMKLKHCRQSAHELKAGDVVTIWYENDLIYQLATEQEVYLPYRYLKRYVWLENINNIFNYLIALLFYVGMFYKSFINCLKPYTYEVSSQSES